MYSEVFAYEWLARCEQATLLKTETEIVYDVVGKKADILVAPPATPRPMNLSPPHGIPHAQQPRRHPRRRVPSGGGCSRPPARSSSW